MARGVADPCGPVYITIGTGGNWGNGAHPWADGPPPSWSVARGGAAGHGILEVTRASLFWRFFSNADARDTSADAATISKPSQAACPAHFGA